MNVIELTEAAEALPPSDRAILADAILRSLDPPESSIDEQWGWLAEKRLSELRTGATTPINGEDVFERILKRFES